MTVLRLALLLATCLHAAAAHGRAGGVATEHALAAAAGAEMLRDGGTVVDAAIATAAAVCVVHTASCGIGGGSFALVHRAGGQGGGDFALDYREVAPAAATPDRFLRDGRTEPSLIRTGGLAVAVPGEVAGWAVLHRRFGRLPLRRVLEPAIRLARDGFRLADTPHLAREVGRATAVLSADAGLRTVFLGGGTSAPGADFRVVQPDLARTLETIATDGRRAFYAGRVAQAIADAAQARGGVLTTDDLARYRPIWRRPLVGTFAGRRIVTFPPPGGGAILLEILGLVAHDDLDALGAGSGMLLHLLASAMAQGFADRARWYGDPEFTTVPVAELLAPPRLRALRARMSATGVYAPTSDVHVDGGTAHVSVVDAEGNAAAITTTINGGFGSGIMVPGTGIILNNEMDDFALAPGVPNSYGLTGSAANAIAPGKRPLSSMSPTVVLSDGRPELVVGGSGGPTIISGTLQVLLGVTAHGLDVRAAVDAPRIHDQGMGPTLGVEERVAPEARTILDRIGHRATIFPAIGAIAAVGLAPDGAVSAAGDRRKDGGEALVH